MGSTTLGGSREESLLTFSNSGLGMDDVLLRSSGWECSASRRGLLRPFFGIEDDVLSDVIDKKEGGIIAGVTNISRTEGSVSPTMRFIAFHTPALRGTSSPVG